MKAKGKNNEFPTMQPTQINQFIDQDDDKTEEGYNSDGNLM